MHMVSLQAFTIKFIKNRNPQIIIKYSVCNDSNNIAIHVLLKNESNICHLFSLFFLLYSICNKAFWNCVKSLTTFYALVYKLLGFMLQNTSFYSLFVRNKRWQRKNIVSIKEKGHCKNYGICKYKYPCKINQLFIVISKP